MCKQNTGKFKLHHVLPGLYGEVSVLDVKNQRWMKINKEIEGRVYLSSIDRKPLPIPVSNYAYIGILPCLIMEESANNFYHGCIFGLGAGMMVSLLLNLFPRLKLTVVEADPTIITLCREYFADINFFEDQNRLEIINNTAENYLSVCTNADLEKFCFFICDIYNGDELSGDCFNLFIKLAKKYPTWANLILHQDIPRYQYLLTNIEQDLNVKLLSFPVAKTQHDSIQSANWVLTNQSKLAVGTLDFVLFEGFSETVEIIKSREIYQQLVSQIPARCFYL